jgi:2-keto-4-pentenoate hydratase/2-oxohepta-3-ene-1,7-dioic acid hydratase in catechol pathway
MCIRLIIAFLVLGLGLAACVQLQAAEVVRFARFVHDGVEQWGIVSDDRVACLEGEPLGAWQRTGRSHALGEVRLLAPVEPKKVLAVGLNYRSHIGARPAPEVPEIFFKLPTSIIGPDEPIVLPRDSSDVHYEAELVVVIGRRGRDIPVEEAGRHVFGVTCGNDVSERRWQKNDLQWWRAKGSDTFGPCGPYLVTGLDYDDLLLTLRHNGEVRQQERTSDLVHSVADIVSWISRSVTLEAGDVIFTGTPGTTRPLADGDMVEVELEGVGVLRNPVVRER